MPSAAARADLLPKCAMASDVFMALILGIPTFASQGMPKIYFASLKK
jgi:hypothetical protein